MRVENVKIETEGKRAFFSGAGWPRTEAVFTKGALKAALKNEPLAIYIPRPGVYLLAAETEIPAE